MLVYSGNNRALLGYLLVATLVVLGSLIGTASAEIAVGTVFEDLNGDGLRNASEPGLAGVRVSNGSAVTTTDINGAWELPVQGDTILFVLKPRGYRTPFDSNQLPQFYYVHRPEGSPPSRFPGVEPTGPLPESINFPLYPQTEPDEFKVLLFGDTQPRDVAEVEYIAHDVVEGLVQNTNCQFGVTLGDVVFDDLSVFQPLLQTVGLIGIPWYNVVGNHDLNNDATSDTLSTETWIRVFGPPYYAFDYGPVHFLVLDDVNWNGPNPPPGTHRYIGGLGPEQLAFIRNDLAAVPTDRLVVLMMHIPLTSPWEQPERLELFELLADRPATLSFAAHTHTMEHHFIGPESGWGGSEPHHHFVNATVCGSWWEGIPDELGIPHTTMRDGAPNGHSVVTFSEAEYEIDFVPARRPVDHQLVIYTPEVYATSDLATAEVVVNVFAGSNRSDVEMRFNTSGPWVPLERVLRPDPYFSRTKAAEQAWLDQCGRDVSRRDLLGLPLPDSSAVSTHIWAAALPADLDTGPNLVQVRTTDMFGRTFHASRIFKIEDR